MPAKPPHTSDDHMCVFTCVLFLFLFFVFFRMSGLFRIHEPAHTPALFERTSGGPRRSGERVNPRVQSTLKNEITHTLITETLWSVLRHRHQTVAVGRGVVPPTLTTEHTPLIGARLAFLGRDDR